MVNIWVLRDRGDLSNVPNHLFIKAYPGVEVQTILEIEHLNVNYFEIAARG